jgi:hypothetical protein
VIVSDDRDADISALVGFAENFFKVGIVSGLLEQRQPTDPPVQDMVRYATGCKRWAPRHFAVASIAPSPALSRKRLPTPFLPPFHFDVLRILKT